MAEDRPRGGIAARQLRALLVKAGLTEPEADRFLDQLSSELSSGEAPQKQMEAALDTFMATVERLKKEPSTAEKVRGIVREILIGLVSAGLYELLKEELWGRRKKPKSVTVPGTTVEAPERWDGEILIEWGLLRPDSSWEQGEQALRLCLEGRRDNYGEFDRRTALSFDALGMCLDGLGRHKEASGFRASAVKAAQRINGLKHPNTAAAMGNLGLCLTARKQYRDAENLLRRAHHIMRDVCGINHLWTLATIMNLYMCLKLQGRFLRVNIPPQIKFVEQQMPAANDWLNDRKKALVLLDSLQVVAAKLKEMLTR